MAAHTQEAIDTIVTDWLELALTDPYVATEWRPKILRKMQEVTGVRVWNYHDFNFKRVRGAAVVITSGDGAVPADFKRIGPRGGVYVQGAQKEVRYADPERILRERQVYPTATGDPEYYTLDAGYFVLDRPTSTTLLVNYEKIRPTLLDNNNANTNGLVPTFPVDLHEVIIWGTIALLCVPAADGRGASEVEMRFAKGLADYTSKILDGAEQFQQYGDYGIPEMEMW